MTDSPRLNELRSEIEQVTLEIIRLAGSRSELALEVAEEKLRTGTPLVNRGVENHLRHRVIEQSERDNHDTSFALRLLNQLISESVRLQGKHIVTPEPVGAYHIFVKANALERSGREVIHLEVGEPDFGPPSAVAESLSIAATQGHAGYTESAGLLELREKIAGHVNQSLGLEISANQITVTVSGRFALYLSLVSCLKAGDEVIVFDPSYPAYSDCIRTAGGRPIHLSTSLENDWNPDIGLLEERINKTTRMIILNSPGNPTGKILDKSTLEQIVELSVKNDIQIVSDEVYSDYSLTPYTSILQFPECNQIYLNSFSKSYGMTGFRLGYAISDVDTIKRITKLQNISLTCAPEFVQYAGIKALDCQKEVDQYTGIIKDRLEIASSALGKLPVSFYRPDGSFYIFPMLNNEEETGVEFADNLLSEKGVAVVPGPGYGSEYSRFFRISVCQPKPTLIEAINRMQEVLG
ncbi:MAG: aminotransferase class I/II-fold pyridoxal phosphate-dependent enzyme [Candidatus Thorarchaeota archaeon]